MTTQKKELFFFFKYLSWGQALLGGFFRFLWSTLFTLFFFFLGIFFLFPTPNKQPFFSLFLFSPKQFTFFQPWVPLFPFF
ncbi:hypothetical protein, partial [Enterococcus faecium]